MGRICSICRHPAREYIDLALIKGEKYRDIAGQFSGEVSKSGLARHRKLHIPKELALGQRAKQVARADDLIGQLEELREIVTKLRRACEKELEDPENPGEYDIGPRDTDITVVYHEFDEEGKLSGQRKARLSELLRRLKDAGIVPVDYRFKIADPRELILKTVNTSIDRIGLLARMLGEIKTHIQVSTDDAELMVFVNAILGVVKDDPEKLLRVEGELKKKEVLIDGRGKKEENDC